MMSDTPPPVVTPIPIVMPAPVPVPPATVTYLIGGRLVVVPVGTPPPNPFAPIPQLMPAWVPQWCPPAG
jgi:hypothetical protein